MSQNFKILGHALSVAIFFSFATPTKTYANIVYDDCLKPKDCIKTKTVCNGVIAINRKHLKSYKLLVEIQESDSLCDKEDPFEIKKNKSLIPKCENNKCVLKSPI